MIAWPAWLWLGHVSQPVKILVVDDDPLPRMVVTATLRTLHYAYAETGRGDDVLPAIERERPDLVILDVRLPGMSGLDAARAMRAAGHRQPVLFLSLLGEVEDRVNGFDAGGDDYLVKPFSVRELAARIRALLQRAQPAPRQVLNLGETQVDLSARTAERAGRPVALTAREFKLLEVLAQAQGRPVARSELLRAVWGYAPSVATRTLDTHLWRLRRKIGAGADGFCAIRNVPGFGYALAEPPRAEPAVRADTAQEKRPVGSTGLDEGACAAG